MSEKTDNRDTEEIKLTEQEITEYITQNKLPMHEKILLELRGDIKNQTRTIAENTIRINLNRDDINRIDKIQQNCPLITGKKLLRWVGAGGTIGGGIFYLIYKVFHLLGV